MTQPPLPFPMDGDARKSEGMARALRGAVPWPDLAWAWIRAQPPGTLFTADDLVDDLGLPHGADAGSNANNAVGAAVNAAARSGAIKRYGYTTAARANSHSRVIGLWERTRQ